MSHMRTTQTQKVAQHVEKVACNGGGGALGHPTVYLIFGSNGSVECYYCGRRFVKQQK